MAVRRHAPKITPLISAAVLLLTTVFLLHRLHPGGVRAVFRGEAARPPSAVAEPAEAVAWGASEGVQIGVTLSKAGSAWLRVLIRNVGSHEAMLACGMEPERSGKLDLVIQDKETAAILRGNALDPATSFRTVLPSGETMSLAVRLPDLNETPGVQRGYAVRVVWSGPVEKRIAGEIHGEETTLESGALHLSRPWPVFRSEGGTRKQRDPDLDVEIEDTRIRVP